LKKGASLSQQNTVLTVIVLAAITTSTLFIFHQQCLAQGQQLQSQSNRTTFDTKNSIEDLSFEIDNMTFSHQTASVNGIQMHYAGGIF
jgi:hypothetical protein